MISAFLTSRDAELFQKKILITEAADAFCTGSFPNYGIRSNSSGTSFIECVEDENAPKWLAKLRRSPEYQWLAQHRTSVVPLPRVAAFQRVLGIALHSALAGYQRLQITTDARVCNLTRAADGWRVRIRKQQGAFDVSAHKVLVATGGKQRSLPQGWPVRAVPSSTVLSPGWRLQPTTPVDAVIVGGSHSAWAAAWRLLQEPQCVQSVTVLSQAPAKPYFDTPTVAREQGFTDFCEHDDTCPLTGRLYRLGGLRGDARDLLLRGHAKLTVRTGIDLYKGNPCEEILAAGMLINALGYLPNLPTIEDQYGKSILPASGRAVDADCRILDVNTQVIPGLYGMGLGFGYRLPAEMGGERSFRGQTNGLWLYQHDVGERVIEGLLSG